MAARPFSKTLNAKPTAGISVALRFEKRRIDVHDIDFLPNVDLGSRRDYHRVHLLFGAARPGLMAVLAGTARFFWMPWRALFAHLPELFFARRFALHCRFLE
jgi:hypothetical protein